MYTKPEVQQPIALDIEQLIKSELSIHPACKLVDIYKLLFQAYFGPAHILKDRDTVANSIRVEALSMQHPYLPLIQDIGNSIGFNRISLSVLLPAVQNNEVLLNEQCYQLADSMQQSCLSASPPFTISELWKANKEIIIGLYHADRTDWQEITAMAERGSIPSHSDAFKSTYDPHYRVIYNLTDLNYLSDSMDYFKEHK